MSDTQEQTKPRKPSDRLADRLEALPRRGSFRVLKLFAAALGALILLATQIGQVRDFVRDHFTNAKDYELIRKLRVDVDKQYIHSLLGTPVLTDSKSARGYVQEYYKRDKYIVWVVISKGRVVVWTVTATDPSFRPEFDAAGEKYRLGKLTFSSLEDSTILYLGGSSKDFVYAESVYLANPGDYQTLLLSLHDPPGVVWGELPDYPDPTAPKFNKRGALGRSMTFPELRGFREQAKPNTFGFSTMDPEWETEFLRSFSAGPIYADVRSFL